MSNGAVGTIMCNFRGSTLENSLRIIGTKGELYTNNFMVPHYYHYLTVKSEDCPKKRTEKHYGTGFSTYHYQLEAFANAIKNNAPFPTNLEDGVKNMRAIDMILAQAGLPPRGMKPPGKI
jgi:predicted dehydrogenase